MVKISKAEDTIPEIEWHCERCNKILPQPVETNGVYAFDGTNPLLLCVECVIGTDLYIWGSPDVL